MPIVIEKPKYDPVISNIEIACDTDITMEKMKETQQEAWEIACTAAKKALVEEQRRKLNKLRLKQLLLAGARNAEEKDDFASFMAYKAKQQEEARKAHAELLQEIKDASPKTSESLSTRKAQQEVRKAAREHLRRWREEFKGIVYDTDDAKKIWKAHKAEEKQRSQLHAEQQSAREAAEKQAEQRKKEAARREKKRLIEEIELASVALETPYPQNRKLCRAVRREARELAFPPADRTFQGSHI